MKIHKYQIEVMWVFLATMFSLKQQGNEVNYIYGDEQKDCIYTDKYNIRNSRPPP